MNLPSDWCEDIRDPEELYEQCRALLANGTGRITISADVYCRVYEKWQRAQKRLETRALGKEQTPASPPTSLSLLERIFGRSRV